MPTISMFYGIIVYMYAEANGKHYIPHLHAEYQGKEIEVSLDGEVLSGDTKSFPPKKLRMLLTWMDIHEEDLRANWDLLSKNMPAFKIDPLK